MNNKGFTLIELLAVIVILAIIALIATPIILGIINDARDNAKKRSAELVYTGIEYAYTTSMYNGVDGTVVVDPTLEDISKNLQIDNVKEKTLSDAKDKLTIVTEDGVTCNVSSVATGFQVECGEYLAAKTLTTKTATN